MSLMNCLPDGIRFRPDNCTNSIPVPVVFLLCTAFLVVLPRTTYSAPPITALASGPREGQLVTASQSGLRPDRFQSLSTQIHDLAFSPNATQLAICGGEPAETGRLEIFNWPDGGSGRSKPRIRLALTDDVLYSVTWSPNGNLIAIGGLDGNAYLIDAESGRKILQLQGHSKGVTSVRFLSDERLLSAGLDQSLRLWNVSDGKLLRTFAHHTGPITGLAVRPGPVTGRLRMAVSVSHDRTVRLWQPNIGRMVRFVRLKSRPLAAEWISGGTGLAVSCRDGDVRIIDPDTAEVSATIQGVTQWAWCLGKTSDRKHLVVAGFNGESLRIQIPTPAP